VSVHEGRTQRAQGCGRRWKEQKGDQSIGDRFLQALEWVLVTEEDRNQGAESRRKVCVTVWGQGGFTHGM
jgi:hypothetical protein